MHLVTLERQIISKSLAIQDCQITSNDLATQEGQISSNQNDACSRHLAMLVCHVEVIKPKARGYMLYRVLRLMKTYLKSITR